MAMRDTLLSAPRIDVPLAVTADGGALELQNGVSMAASADRMATAYLDVRIDLAACPAGVPLVVRYDHTNPFNDFTNPVQPQPYNSIPERVLIPVFRGFKGLGLGGAEPRCVARVQRLQSINGIPLLPILTLPSGWQHLPPHQTVGWQALRLWRLGS